MAEGSSFDLHRPASKERAETAAFLRRFHFLDTMAVDQNGEIVSGSAYEEITSARPKEVLELLEEQFGDFIPDPDMPILNMAVHGLLGKDTYVPMMGTPDSVFLKRRIDKPSDDSLKWAVFGGFAFCSTEPDRPFITTEFECGVVLRQDRFYVYRAGNVFRKNKLVVEGCPEQYEANKKVVERIIANMCHLTRRPLPPGQNTNLLELFNGPPANDT